MVPNLFFALCLSFTLNHEVSAGPKNDASEERTYVHKCYEIITPKIDLHYTDYTDTYSRLLDLPPALLPTLPPGYKWLDINEKRDIWKHREAPDVDIELIPYEKTSNRFSFDYVVMHDRRHKQAFCHTRTPVFSKERTQMDWAPMVVEDYKPYIRGHCIDFQDTKGTPLIKYTSTLDPRNYLPEPKRYWATTARNSLVRDIRNKNGVYTQYAYYNSNPKYTQNHTAVPEGVYFVGMNQKYQQEEDSDIFKTFHIPWAHQIHKSTARNGSWRHQLSPLSSHFYPKPFVERSLSSDKEYMDQVVSWEAKEGYQPHETLYGLFQVASHELYTVSGKLDMSIRLMTEHQDQSLFAFAQKAAISQFEFLDSLYDSKKELFSMTQYKKFTQILSKSDWDPHDELFDFWYQTYQNRQEEDLGVGKLLCPSPDRSSPLSPEQQTSPKTLIISGSLKSLKKTSFDLNDISVVTLDQMTHSKIDLLKQFFEPLKANSIEVKVSCHKRYKAGIQKKILSWKAVAQVTFFEN